MAVTICLTEKSGVRTDDVSARAVGLLGGRSVCDGRGVRAYDHRMSGISIRVARGAGEYPLLVRVWRSAVDATHDFLADEHRAQIEDRLPTDYLPHVNLVVAERDGVPVGFAGTHDGNLEMLFVDAGHRGRGIGTALLEHVIATDAVASVDVNEQNEQALGFYLHAGFVVSGRSPVDGDGWPYPLVHMTLAGRRDDAEGSS